MVLAECTERELMELERQQSVYQITKILIRSGESVITVIT